MTHYHAEFWMLMLRSLVLIEGVRTPLLPVTLVPRLVRALRVRYP